MQLAELIAAALGGGGITVLGQFVTGWWAGRREDRNSERDNDTKVEQHRDNLTFQLLEAAREEMSTLRDELSTMRAEAAQLRPLLVVGAHLEEALDHLHALLHAETPEELRAAERRAKAFLRRMRPEVGDLRNNQQRATSKAVLEGRADNEGTDSRGDHVRKLPAKRRGG